MPMYNLLEHGDNYSITSGSLWNYYRNEVNDDTDYIGMTVGQIMKRQQKVNF